MKRYGQVFLLAIGFDLYWTLTGLIAFTGASLMPLWMVALWLMFATVWPQLTRTTTLPGWLLTVLATLGGPVAYLIGERLGAVYRLYLSASDARRQLYRVRRR